MNYKDILQKYSISSVSDIIEKHSILVDEFKELIVTQKDNIEYDDLLSTMEEEEAALSIMISFLETMHDDFVLGNQGVFPLGSNLKILQEIGYDYAFDTLICNIDSESWINSIGLKRMQKDVDWKDNTKAMEISLAWLETLQNNQ